MFKNLLLNYIIYLSFDVGIKNLAYCKLDETKLLKVGDYKFKKT